ncbi:MAG: hypothetical protein WBF34_10660 [Streptosporangiaceae bacterium]
MVSGRDYEFANDLIREALYASTPEPTRLAHHRRLEMLALRELGGDVPVSLGLPISYYAANLESGLRIAESLGDRASEADMLSRLAIIAGNRLRLDAALDYGLRAVAAGRAAADDQALAAGLDGLKFAYLSVGDTSALANVLAELGPLLRRLGDSFRSQWAEFEGAFLSVAAAEWDGATAAIRAAVEVNHRGYPQWVAWYVAHLGWLTRLRGRDDEAVTLGPRALVLIEQHEHSWIQATACAMLGGTMLVRGDRAGAIELFERGLAAGQQAGMEAYLLRSAAPLAAATGSLAMLGEAVGLLEKASIPTGGAWVFGYEAYLSVAQAWLGHDDPERARAVLAPLLEVAEREPWQVTLAEVVDGRALIRLGRKEQARTELGRAAWLAREHGLPHVRHDAQSAQRLLR